MRKIYFDDTLIDTDYYGGLTKTSELHNDKLKLGATLCETYKFTVDKTQIEDKEPSVVYLYNNDELEKTLFVDNYKEEDFTITYELTDSMVNFNFGYDASQIFVDGKTTLGDIFQDICLKANLTTDITTFDYSSMEVSWYDNSITARDYLGFIATLNCSYLYITPDNKLAMAKVNQSSKITINFDEIGNYKIGQKHKITRVYWDDEAEPWIAGDETGDTYYLDTANVFIIDESIVEHIYDEIVNFEFYDFEVDNMPIKETKNLFDYSKIENIALGNTIVSDNKYKGFYMPYKAGTTLTFSRNTTINAKNNRFRIAFTYDKPANNVRYYNKNGAVGNSHNYDAQLNATLTSNIEFNYVFLYLSNNSTEPITENDVQIQIEKGDTATDYVPYFPGLYTGDIITFTDGENEYKTIYQPKNLTLSGDDFYGGLSFQVKTAKQDETQIIDTDKRIRGIKRIVDRDNNRITTLISDTTVLERRVSDNETATENNYQDLLSKFDGVATEDEITQIQQSMQTQMDANSLEIANIQSVIANGVEKVITTSGTFDENGLTMEKTDAKTKSVLDETGLDIQDSQGSSDEDLFFAGYVDSEKAQTNEDLTAYEGQTVVYTRNIIVKNYFTIGTNSRIEDFEDGTGVFYIGGE